MRRTINIALISITALATSNAIAQTFPVRVTPVLTPPYTPFLTDYTDPGAERLTLQIMLNDLTVTEFRTKLRMTIEGVGITITTNPNYFPPPISLQGGVPQLIYGSDIADYFKMSNLVFQGLNPNEVQKNGGRLPEGIYRISFEVLDYNRNTVVSNKGSATAWMILNDPPFINLPLNNAKIKPLNPQNIGFQWTPRHRGSPNAAFTTDYDVKLVEIWPAGRNPFDAINTSRPIYETTTSATMVVYGPAETPLVLGREYALQVRARDNGGRDVFKNNGYSEVVRFIYGDECPMPSGLNADDINISKARMRWQGSGQNSDYLLRYREKKEGARWFEEKTNQSYYNATGLRAGTTYEYQLAGACDIYESEETQIETFTTLTENPNAFVCADPNSVPPPDGSPPLPALFTNDFIHAGGFDMVVNKATGSNGRFTGEGLAVVPWFNSAKVRVTFENIGVNTSYQLTAGEIKSVWDANSEFLVESKKDLNENGANGNPKADSTATSIITFPGIVDSVYVNENGKIVVVDANGRKTEYDQPITASAGEKTPVTLTDSEGSEWSVDKNGSVSTSTNSNNTNSPKALENLKGLDSIIYEVAMDISKSITLEKDTAMEEVSKKSIRLENVIEKGGFYPPRIRGLNDEFIGEGMSKYASLIERSNEEREQMEDIMLELDSTRNDLFLVDVKLQLLKNELSYIGDQLMEARFPEFSKEVQKKIDPNGDNDALWDKIKVVIVEQIKENVK